MEGNLSRARSSLRMSPSPSASPVPIGSHQGFNNFSRTISRSERRAQTSLAGALLRQRASQDLHNSFHSRGFSDVYAPSWRSSFSNRETKSSAIRSLSALGSTNASGFGASDSIPKQETNQPKLSYRASVSVLPYPREEMAKPSTTQVESVTRHESPTSNNPPKHSSLKPTDKTPKTLEEFNSTYPATPPSRSHSQLQVRGLQDQMQDLKTKISTLKVKADEDNLRRRSLQSLRTPSPFNNAEEWYTGVPEYRNDDTDNTGVHAISSLNVLPTNNGTTGDDSNRNVIGQAVANSSSSESEKNLKSNTPEIVRDDDEQSISESHYEDADDGLYDENGGYSSGSDIDRAALAEILNEPLDSPTPSDDGKSEAFPAPPVETTRHEDREDAFDYENFFLHSALGNYSRSRYRRESYSSTGSVETTRPASPPGASSSTRVGKHGRTNSADSVSSSATFATATEGMGSDEDDGEEDYSNDEINNALYWNGNTTAASNTRTGKSYCITISKKATQFQRD